MISCENLPRRKDPKMLCRSPTCIYRERSHLLNVKKRMKMSSAFLCCFILWYTDYVKFEKRKEMIYECKRAIYFNLSSEYL